MVDFLALKKDFPLLARPMNGKPLVYLDSASTTQKPQVVIDALVNYYTSMNANIHRGVYTLSEQATEAYESTRKAVADFIHAREAEELIFTRNATEAFNLVAYSYGEAKVQQGDVVVVSALEHHSNLVPWQELCKRKQAELRVIPLRAGSEADGGVASGTLDLQNLEKIIDEKVKVVAVTQMSNVLGTIVPLEPIIKAAHAVGAVVIIDGAQGAGHLGIDVQKTDVDFYAFSAHKMLGPTGVGILYGKRALLEAMPPFLFGGDMVKEVQPYQANWNDVPWKFEAGTPNIADVIASAKALEYLQGVGLENIFKHDQELLQYARQKLSSLPGIQMYGSEVPAASGILSFNIPGVHPHDVGSILNEEGVAIRTGHHCCQPLMRQLAVNATARMSFYFYNDKADIDMAFEALKKVYSIFKI